MKNAIPYETGEPGMDEGEFELMSDLILDDDDLLGYVEPDRIYTARQLIEIAREDRWLESVMSDLDHFSGIDDYDGNFADEFAH